MSFSARPATAAECDRIWPAIKADHLMGSVEELRDYHAQGPWRVRVTERGEACLLGRWKQHLDVLSMRGLWCAERHVGGFVADAAAVARGQGFGRVLSPLVPECLARPYVSAGMEPVERLVAIQGGVGDVRPAVPPEGVRIRTGRLADVPALTELDAACFEPFWSWSAEDLASFLTLERLGVAENGSGELIGYTLATVSRGAATLTRLGTHPSYRRRGLARALLFEAAEHCRNAGAETISLCTQEGNSASRATYASAGLIELDERYVLAIMDAGPAGR